MERAIGLDHLLRQLLVHVHAVPLAGVGELRRTHLVPEAENGLLAHLTLVSVDLVVGNLVNARRHVLVDVMPAPEHVQRSLVARDPEDPTSLDRRVVGADQIIALGGGHRATQSGRQNFHRAAVYEVEVLSVCGQHRVTQIVDVLLHGTAREVLRLNEPTGPASRVRTVVRQKASCSAIRPDDIVHRHVLLGRCFCLRLAKLERLQSPSTPHLRELQSLLDGGFLGVLDVAVSRLVVHELHERRPLADRSHRAVRQLQDSSIRELLTLVRDS